MTNIKMVSRKLKLYLCQAYKYILFSDNFYGFFFIFEYLFVIPQLYPVTHYRNATPYN